MRIRVIKTPPGLAPDDIRESWVGVEMTAQNNLDDGSGLRDSIQNAGGYKVLTQDAIDALRKANKEDAAVYWECVAGSIALVFHKDCCEEI